MNLHSFHIPVMGIGFTLDTPIKVAKYGIDSVVSLVQDDVIEKAGIHYAEEYNLPYTETSKKEKNFRSTRITNYLNLLQKITNHEFELLKKNDLELEKYFDLLPENNHLKILYQNAQSWEEMKAIIESIKTGRIDVNIMSKLDRDPGNGDFTDASAALDGFANSNLDSAVIVSAGVNPKFISHFEQYADFFPTQNTAPKKKIILKVSDYRSALIQGKMLAKKGLWPYEFRLESGLNCGGHAFATQGLLMGPILEEFKSKRVELLNDLLAVYNIALEEKQIQTNYQPEVKVTAQGGIGTNDEQDFLNEHYDLNGTGWGSPFLLVPEATTIDDITLNKLAKSKPEDIVLSNASPLGVLYNNLKDNPAEELRKKRIEEGKPGSPCFKKHASLNTEYGKVLCTASREFQKKKIKDLEAQNLPKEQHQQEFDSIVEKECICDGLAISFLKRTDQLEKDNNPAPSVCPGPNLGYFNRTYSLKEMIDHIYGRENILENERPNVFMKELKLYVDYFLKEAKRPNLIGDRKMKKYYTKFQVNLLDGIQYYESLFIQFKNFKNDSKTQLLNELDNFKLSIGNINLA